ncbi:hypothetical protein GCM10027093_36630 [Paraburkholderia jirisanensis]
MKLVTNVVSAAAILIPLSSYAAGPITHAQVVKELEQLEAVGYNPGIADDSYPGNLEQAQAVLNQRRAAAASYGPDMQGTTQSGR